jgi:hypothetical protein
MDDHVRDLLKLFGMMSFVQRERAEFLDSLGPFADDATIRRVVHEAAKAYGGGTEAGAAFWEPALMQQARQLGLFSDPSAASVTATTMLTATLSSSASMATHEAAMALLAKGCARRSGKVEYWLWCARSATRGMGERHRQGAGRVPYERVEALNGCTV